MGTSPQMLCQHYRELVRPDAAEFFFGLLPSPDAPARACAARVDLTEAARLARVASARAAHQRRAKRHAAPASVASVIEVPAAAGNEKAGRVRALPGPE